MIVVKANLVVAGFRILGEFMILKIKEFSTSETTEVKFNRFDRSIMPRVHFFTKGDRVKIKFEDKKVSRIQASCS